MTNRLKAGIIGLGILGRQHTEFLHTHPAVEVTAVSDLRASAAEELAASIAATPFTDYQAMLRQHALDLVVVATPDAMHRAPTLAAIDAGVRHIIQEKPLATTQADAAAIYDAVERTGTRLFVNFANRAAPLDLATRYVLQRGLLGRPVYGEARLDDNISVPTRMWGERSRAWAAASSSAHFLLSHVVDLLRWYFAPAEVTDVYAVTQQAVLGYTPDLYDAFLTFDTGLKVRAKAEWIKHIDELVEFYLCFSGSEGTLIYHKRPGFGSQASWRANLSTRLNTYQLLQHRRTLLERGIAVRGLIYQRRPATGQLVAGDSTQALALEHLGPTDGGTMALVGPIIDAILEETAEPACWQGNGPLPDHVDGLRQTQIVLAIIESGQTGKPVAVSS